MKLDINQMMQQAKKIQEEMAKKQEELANKTFEASSGGGMVTALVNGRFELLSIKFDPEVVNRDDIEMLQDLVVASINEALKKAQEAAKNILGNLMGGTGIF